MIDFVAIGIKDIEYFTFYPNTKSKNQYGNGAYNS